MERLKCPRRGKHIMDIRAESPKPVEAQTRCPSCNHVVAVYWEPKSKRKEKDNEVSRIDGIKILFHDKEIETVVVSKIKLWNGGNVILETSDFYPSYELSIKVPQNEKILAAIINEETDETCKVNIQNSTQDENIIRIDFYCLEPRQGATITIYHTNIDEKETEVIGKIKGGKVLNRSVEMIIEDGEMCMATGSHKIYFGGLFRPYIRLARNFPEMFGISIVKTKKK